MSWASLRGHEALIEAFRQVVSRGRLAHAYLFVGPEGVGKKRFALELARMLLCEDPAAPVRGDACDRCPGCVQIEARTHPDFQLVGLPEDRHEFPIALIQEVIRNLALRPARGRQRVAIIDDADQLNEESANAFLKTLEEPPPSSLLILIGTSPDRQLPTIRSRCQLIRFAPLPEEVVSERLVGEGVVENLEAARALARFSGGSLSEARALADPELRGFRLELIEALGRERNDPVALGDRLVKFVEEAGKESAERRQRAGRVMKFLIEVFRAALMSRQGLEPSLFDARENAAAIRLAERFDEEQLLTGMERCLQANFQVDRRLQLSLVLEALMDALGTRWQSRTG
jgi:DNA polymerase-3 subunit delta'